MTRVSVVFAAALGLALLAAPAQAACPKNPPKPTTVDGVKVKKGSCGPFMMKADDLSSAHYDCSDAKGNPLRAAYNDCSQLNAKGSKTATAKKPAKASKKAPKTVDN